MSNVGPLVAAEETIGKYRLIGVLAEGGMARLYLAEQLGPLGFKKVVALKRVLPHLAGEPQFRQMFLNEAIVAARLDHSNIVKTYELGEVDGQYFISMEYLPGEDLAVTAKKSERRGPMPIEIAAAIGQHCAHALSYAHEFVSADGSPMCIVHRDVNPSNIVVTYYGEVKLLDFGIAKVRDGKDDARTRNFRGKLSYAAPEQLAGEPVDGRTDIFCLGIVLWESLTGKRLFDGPSEATRLEAVRTRTVIAPSKLRPGVPVELDDIVMKALARDRDQRYASAREMCEALDRYLATNRRSATPRAIGAWLENVFGSERAAAKRATAQGHDLARNLALLHRIASEERDSLSNSAGPPPLGKSLRLAWSTDLGGGASIGRTASQDLLFAVPSSSDRGAESLTSTPLPSLTAPPPGVAPSFHSARHRTPSVAPIVPPLGPSAPPVSVGPSRASATPHGVPSLPPQHRTLSDHISQVRPLARDPDETPQSRGRLIAIAVLVLAVLGGSLYIMFGSRPETSPASRAARGSIEITSEPAGAQILVDGEPTGLHTPATLRDLPLQKTIDVRVEKLGYTGAHQTFTLASDALQRHAFRLEASVGFVKLTGLPDRKASVYVDSKKVDVTRPIELSLGKHNVRVEAGEELLLTRTIDVVAGEQSIDLASP